MKYNTNFVFKDYFLQYSKYIKISFLDSCIKNLLFHKQYQSYYSQSNIYQPSLQSFINHYPLSHHLTFKPPTVQDWDVQQIRKEEGQTFIRRSHGTFRGSNLRLPLWENQPSEECRMGWGRNAHLLRWRFWFYFLNKVKRLLN